MFIRIDCGIWPPINLLHGDKLDKVNFAADKFLEVDSSCFDLIHDNINEQKERHKEFE